VGAAIQDRVFRELPVQRAHQEPSKEKLRIGAMAATVIQEGETIILDSHA
jgi:DeoR family transcriptional regulator, aga operon transcriptional repressor